MIQTKIYIYKATKDQFDKLKKDYKDNQAFECAEAEFDLLITEDNKVCYNSKANTENKEEYLILTNGVTLELELKESKETNIEASEVKEEMMPAFGITIDDNFSIHQFYMDTEAAIKIIEPFLAYWNINGDLVVDNTIIEKEILKEKIGYITEKGYHIPVTIIMEDVAVIKDGKIEAYLNKKLQTKKTLFRVMTYKDYAYIKNINKEIYEEIKKIKENPSYKKIDKVDYYGKFINNYSEKKRALSFYAEKNVDKNRKSVMKSTYSLEKIDTPIFHYVLNAFDYPEFTELNNNLAMTIKKNKYFNAFESGNKKSGYAAYGEQLQSALNLYRYIDVDEIDSRFAKNTVDDFEEVKEDKTFDALSREIFDIKYIKKEMDDVLKFSKGEKDVAIVSVNPAFFINVCFLGDILNSEKQEIKFIKTK